MWRSRLGWAGLASLLLHAMLLALLWSTAPARPVAGPEPERSEWVVVEVDPTPRPATPQPPPMKPPPARPPPPKPPPAPRRETPRKEPASDAATAPQAPPENAASSPPSDVPLAPPAAPSLRPSLKNEGWSLPVTPEKPRGRTLRPDDPSLAPEVLAAEERARVSAKVREYAVDELARLRVENGAVHPYFGGLRTALAEQLEDAPLFGLSGGIASDTVGGAQHLARSYGADAEEFGATGNPGGSVPLAPTASEKLKNLVGDDPYYEDMRARLQAGVMLRNLGNGGRTPALTVVLELAQAPDGTLRSVRVLQHSTNVDFDTYVLEKVAAALAALPPPPSNAAGLNPEGFHTVWAVEGRVTFRKRLSEVRPGDGLYGLFMASQRMLTGNFDESTGDVYVTDLTNPSFTCQPRLLRVY